MDIMNTLVKLLAGLIIFALGLYWYAPVWEIGRVNFLELKGLIRGGIGLVLIFIGLVIAWIEYEDHRWAQKENAEKAKTP
ncbi:MAG: hypothetical protein HY832_00315 [Candidatus Aenigmarchaeota archaeon]|nr:hypothetical protein [Candidatus Aenigmarchaeota archaeon]